MISERSETQVREAPQAPDALGAPDAEPYPDEPYPPYPESAPAKPRRRWWPWLLAAAVALLGAYLLARHNTKTPDKAGKGPGGGAADAANRPVPVQAVPAATKDVPVYLTGLGSVVPLNTVSVKSRVDGQVLRITFREGQIVRAGDLLAELDPRPFQVQLMQAEGVKGKDEAALRNAQVDLHRYEVLMQQDSIPRQQLDTQAAAVAQLEAALKSDQAQIESAKLNLAYSRVTAPTGGRVGLRGVDVGNILHAGDPNGIVVITQLQPIDVLFTIPADQLPQVLPKLHAGQALAVDAYDRDLKQKLATGRLLAADNQIDPTTGTVRLKALFPNGDEALFPNQFVNARLLVDTARNAVTVPTAALQRSPQGTYVYVVKADKTVESRTVEVGITEGDAAAIQSGLAAGEMVVVDGVDKLRPGSKVDLGSGNGSGGTGGSGGRSGRGGAGGGNGAGGGRAGGRGKAQP